MLIFLQVNALLCTPEVPRKHLSRRVNDGEREHLGEGEVQHFASSRSRGKLVDLQR